MKRLHPDLPWALNSAGTVQPPSLRHTKLMEKKSSLFHEIFTLEKGRSFVYCHWPWGGGEDCNQVSWSQFSQLHIIIWFRYLIHALKLKTCLELTNALLSHRLQRGTYHLPISSYWPRHGPWVETLCPEHYKKRKRNKKVKWKCLHLAFFCVWWFFFLPKASKWKGRANRSLAPSPLPETEWGLQNFLLLCSYLREA